MSVKVKKSRGQWGMLNLFRKNSAFFDEKWPEKFFGKNHHSRLFNWKVFHRLVHKYEHIKAYCKDKTQKYTVCPLKNLKIQLLSLITQRKKFSAAKSLQYDWWWTRRSVYIKVGWIRPIGAEKIRFKEMKRRGMSRAGKKRNHFDVFLCEKALLRSSEKQNVNMKAFLFHFKP